MRARKIITIFCSMFFIFLCGCSSCSNEVIEEVVTNESPQLYKSAEAPKVETIREERDEICKEYTYYSTEKTLNYAVIPDYIREGDEIYYYTDNAECSYEEYMTAVVNTTNVEIGKDESVDEVCEFVSPKSNKEYTLDNKQVILSELKPVKKIITEEVEYGPVQEKVEPEETKDIIYYDDVLNEDVSVSATLTESGVIDEGYYKDEPIEATFIATDNDTYEYELNGKNVIISPESETPVWEGYENDIFEELNINPDNNYITEAKWLESYVDEEGRNIRKAQYTNMTYAYRQYARYEAVGEQLGYEAAVLYYTDAAKVNADEKDITTLYKVTVLAYFAKEEKIMSSLKEYKQINGEVEGIVAIKGSVLHHPFVCSNNREDYYLRRDLLGNYNSHGVPFVTTEHSFTQAGTNNIIYGHNICRRERDCFADIVNYENEDYVNQHPYIHTCTDNGAALWKVFAFYKTDTAKDLFLYNECKQFDSKEKFDVFLNEVRKRNELDNHFVCSYNDVYLTLSTCYYYSPYDENGRCCVMAKRVYI